VFKIKVSLCEHCTWSGTGIWNCKKVSLEARPEDKQRRCRSDLVLDYWDTVPGHCAGCSSSRYEQRQSERLGPQRWRRVPPTISNEDEAELYDEPRRPPLDSLSTRYTTVQTRERVYTRTAHMKAIRSEVWSLQSMQLAKEQSDVVEPRRRKDEASSGVHHWLEQRRIGEFEGSGGVRASSSSAAVYSPYPPLQRSPDFYVLRGPHLAAQGGGGPDPWTPRPATPLDWSRDRKCDGMPASVALP